MCHIADCVAMYVFISDGGLGVSGVSVDVDVSLLLPGLLFDSAHKRGATLAVGVSVSMCAQAPCERRPGTLRASCRSLCVFALSEFI